MTQPCPHCGKPVNPAAMLGAIRTPKKEAAWKANGAKLKSMYEEFRRGKAAILAQPYTPNHPAMSPTDENRVMRAVITDTDTRVMPKGSMSKDDLKAMLAGSRVGKSESPREEVPLWNTPTAPFDFKDDNGDPHRVKAYGKTLKVCFLRDGVEEPIRNLGEGELESLWERRIIK